MSSASHTVAAAPQKPAPDAATTARRWYGWETLSLDAAALGLGVMSFSTFDGQGSAGALLGSGALSTYAFGGPAVHLLRDQPGKAMTSLGLRVGLPVLAVGAVVLGNGGGCTPASERDDVERCQPYKQRLLVTGAISVVVASLIDGALLAWQPPAKPKPLTLSPAVGWDGASSGMAGFAGTF